MMSHTRTLALALAGGLALMGCDDQTKKDAPPTANTATTADGASAGDPAAADAASTGSAPGADAASAGGAAGATRGGTAGASGEGGADVSLETLKALSADNNAFAFDLYKQVGGSKEGNVFMSPLSVSLALAMTYAGAAGETAKELADVMHYTLPGEELHGAMAALEQHLEPASETAPIQLAIANRVWSDTRSAFQESYLDLVGTYYGAGAEKVAFAQTEDARETINTWVSEQTNALIPELLKPNDIDASTLFVLTSAIYFKGAWTQAFDPKLTSDAPFNAPDGPKDVPFMTQTAKFEYGEVPGAQVLALPYDGGAEMVVILPKEADGLGAVEAALSEKTLAAWRGKLREQKVRVRLPRFTMRVPTSLKDTFKAMGVEKLFDPKADLSKLMVEPAYVTEIIHEAFVEVNEEGTEAAAATAVVGARGGRPAPTPRFVADRPFFFVIRDVKTGAITFMGRLVTPEEG